MEGDLSPLRELVDPGGVAALRYKLAFGPPFHDDVHELVGCGGELD
jgi:hypothetical protein